MASPEGKMLHSIAKSYTPKIYIRSQVRWWNWNL